MSQNRNMKPSLIDVLPREIVSYIMSFLDLESLCRAASVCRFFKEACYDPLLYKVLNLQIYSHKVKADTLFLMHSRLTNLIHLNIAGCGRVNRLDSSFFRESCVDWHNLTTLKVSSCPFIDDKSMFEIANLCTDLEVFEMRFCNSSNLTIHGFLAICFLSKLTHLDLYRTAVTTPPVLAIIKRCTKLKHLSLGDCVEIHSCDDIARCIAKYLKNIQAINFWRISSLTCAGVNDLAECCERLVELDIGWCVNVDASCGCIGRLVMRNPELKKIVFTANRSISNNELYAVAKHCKKLERLNIVGVMIGLDCVRQVLESCRKLKCLEVFNCPTSVGEAVPSLRESFPQVEIKCSLTGDFMAFMELQFFQ